MIMSPNPQLNMSPIYPVSSSSSSSSSTVLLSPPPLPPPPPPQPSGDRSSHHRLVNTIREYKNERNEMFYECSGCRFNGDLISIMTHLKSSSHLRLFNNDDDEVDNYQCDICNLTFNLKKPYLIHLASEPHRDVLRKSMSQDKKKNENDINDLSDLLSATNLQSPVSKSDYYCTDCNVDLKTKGSLYTHLASPEHKNCFKKKDTNNNNAHISSQNGNLKLDGEDKDKNKEVRCKIVVELDESSTNREQGEEKSSPTTTATKNGQTLPRSQSDFVLSSSHHLDADSIKKRYETSNDWCHCCYVRYTSTAHKTSHLTGASHQKKYAMKEVTMKSEQVPAFLCDVCFVTSNSAEQLECHMKSAVHLDTLKKREEYEASRNKLSPYGKKSSSTSPSSLTPSTSHMSIPKSVTVSDIKLNGDMVSEAMRRRSQKDDDDDDDDHHEIDNKAPFYAIDSFNNKPIKSTKLISVFQYVDESNENEEIRESVCAADMDMENFMEENINSLKSLSDIMLKEAQKHFDLTQKILF